ncbi:MAG: bifunctional homocysteine S-methyltransferase/methylenetetrahydrofolate reductase [Victivallales bacterium]|jgi:homocysteine S-methyltransferase|nr:bifunctional homocysteine S-methyltransferase/methylenetetrahydrofolate reductase [Victivallales bacterium]
MNSLQRKLSESLTIFDGAIGTEIYRRNFFVNASFEQLSVSNPEVILDIHRQYLDAGAEVLTTNTFNANARRLGKFGLTDQVTAINRAGAELARRAIDEADLSGKILIAGSIGPIGEPESVADTRDRATLIAEQLEALVPVTDFIIFESLRTVIDLGAALEAIKKFPDLVYILSFAIDRHAENCCGDGLDEFKQLISTFPGSRPSAIGLNCGGGPESTLAELELLVNKTALPIVVQPNAGQPRGIDGRMIYMTSAEYFSTYAKRYAMLGAAAIGGCCGISPAHIQELARTIKPLSMAEKRDLPKVEIVESDLPSPVPISERSKLGSKLAAKKFVTSIEITPPRGFDLSATIAGARKCLDFGIDAVNLPDGPRASSRISPLVTAIAIEQQVGIETVLHCCCRDKSLLGLQADLLGCAGMGINNILFITGDPPKLGDYPYSSGVFDVDSIGLVKIQSRLNRGVDLGGKPINAPTKALIGVGADPNAIDPEREYRRICEKIEAGADFIITQPVFAPETLFAFIDRIEQLKIPLIAGIWPLVSYRNAEFMKTEVPGVVVPDAIMERMASAATREAQRDAGIEIAKESIREIRSRVQGLQISAPFGNVELALKVLK